MYNYFAHDNMDGTITIGRESDRGRDAVQIVIEQPQADTIRERFREIQQEQEQQERLEPLEQGRGLVRLMAHDERQLVLEHWYNLGAEQVAAENIARHVGGNMNLALAQSYLSDACNLFEGEAVEGAEDEEEMADACRMMSNIGQFLNENAEAFQQFMDEVAAQG